MTKRKATGHPGYIEIMKAAEKKIVTSSKQLEDFDGLYGDVLNPPYEPKDLLRIVEESSYLKQYIKAMATNIAMFGHAIKYKDDFDYDREEDMEIKKEADMEWDKLTRLYKYINPTEPFKKVIEKMVIDRESIGWGAIEIMRDGKGEVSHIEYFRAANIRICKLNNDESNPVEFKVLEKDNNGDFITQTYYKKFKKFVQIVGGNKRYFKEFGDTRQLNYETGKYEDRSNEDNKQATEIAFFPIHDPSTDYGVPRWTGSLADVIGNRSSEILNFTYFESGTILPAAIIVDGGQLTEESIEALKDGKGIGNAFKILLLETAPFEDEEFAGMDDKKNRVSTKIEKLADTMNKDAMFQEYQKNSKEKVRDNFRLPPIFTGQSTDYTRSTADTSRIIAEEQIFVPERADITSIFNTIINNELGTKYVEMYLQGPMFSDIADKSKALIPYIQGGAVTPNMLIEPLEELLGTNIEPLPDEIGNIPIEILKLQMAIKQRDLSESKIELEKSDTIDKSIDVLYEMMRDIKKYLSDDHE